ncbi:MAG: hypothetical protein MHMPM18_004206 [Marteilia pararefringens]
MEKRKADLDKKFIDSLKRDKQAEEDKMKEIIAKHKQEYEERIRTEKAILTAKKYDSIRNITLKCIRVIEKLRKIIILYDIDCHLKDYPKFRLLKERALFPDNSPINRSISSVIEREMIMDDLDEVFIESEVKDIKDEVQDVTDLSRSVKNGKTIKSLFINMICKYCETFQRFYNMEFQFVFEEDRCNFIESNNESFKICEDPNSFHDLRTNNFDFIIDEMSCFGIGKELPKYLEDGYALSDHDIIECFFHHIKNFETNNNNTCRVKNFPHDAHQLKIMSDYLFQVVKLDLRKVLSKSFLDEYEYLLRECADILLSKVFSRIYVVDTLGITTERDSIEHQIEFHMAKTKLLQTFRTEYSSKCYKIEGETPDYSENMCDSLDGKAENDSDIINLIDLNPAWRNYICYSLQQQIIHLITSEHLIFKAINMVEIKCKDIIW